MENDLNIVQKIKMNKLMFKRLIAWTHVVIKVALIIFNWGYLLLFFEPV